ncbi:MAG TPA: hypothetical protein VJO32_04245 [Ktedonobacteraceae bacterium]|nr:hypothetical protein [Ktedonobacteraceae bacterium]
MVRLYRMTIAIASAGMLLLLAGCGQNSTGNNASPPVLSGTPGTAQLVKTGIVPTNVPPHSSPTPTAPAQLSGKVALQLTTVPQNAGASVVLTLKNATNQTIRFSDHLTECTVVLLQVQPPSAASSGTWLAVAPCKLMTATRLHELEAGKSLTITLIAPGGQWTPGLYRALLSYVPSGADHTPQTVFSPSFQVGS